MWLYIWIAYAVMGLYTWYRLVGALAHEKMDDGNYAALSFWELLGFGSLLGLVSLFWPAVLIGRGIIRFNKYLDENKNDMGDVIRAMTPSWDIKTKQQRRLDAENKVLDLRNKVKSAS